MRKAARRPGLSGQIVQAVVESLWADFTTMADGLLAGRTLNSTTSKTFVNIGGGATPIAVNAGAANGSSHEGGAKFDSGAADQDVTLVFIPGNNEGQSTDFVDVRTRIADDAGTFYLVQTTYSGTTLYSYNNGSLTTVGNVSNSMVSNVINTMRFRILGQTADIWLNGVQIFTGVTMPTLSTIANLVGWHDYAISGLALGFGRTSDMPTQWTDNFKRSKLGYPVFENDGLFTSGGVLVSPNSGTPESVALPVMVSNANHIECDVVALPGSAPPGHYIQIAMHATSGFGQYVIFFLDYLGRLILADQTGVIAGDFNNGIQHSAGHRLVCDLTGSTATMTYDGQTISATTATTSGGVSVLRIDRDSQTQIDNLLATPAPTIFYDNFQRPNGDAGYSHIDGVLTIVNHQATGETSDGRGFGMVPSGVRYNNIDVVFDTGTSGNVRVYFLGVDANNTLRVDYNQTAAALYQWVNGNFSILWNGDFSQKYPTNTQGFHLGITIDRVNKQVHLLGHVTSFDPSLVENTYIGLGTDGIIFFDSITATV